MDKIVLCWCSQCGCSWGHRQSVETEGLEAGSLSPCCRVPLSDVRPTQPMDAQNVQNVSGLFV